MRRVRRTWSVFFEHNGRGPWTCFESTCRGQITRLGRDTWDGNVHHRDGDVENDTPDNLVVMHTICHQRVHEKTPELRARISAKLKGRPSPTRGMHFSEETNRKKSLPGTRNGFYGKQHTEVSLQKMRTPRQRSTCVHCGRSYAKNWIERHVKEGLCIAQSTHLASPVALH